MLRVEIGDCVRPESIAGFSANLIAIALVVGEQNRPDVGKSIEDFRGQFFVGRPREAEDNVELVQFEADLFVGVVRLDDHGNFTIVFAERFVDQVIGSIG
jgi:hypothetical protein